MVNLTEPGERPALPAVPCAILVTTFAFVGVRATALLTSRKYGLGPTGLGPAWRSYSLPVLAAGQGLLSGMCALAAGSLGRGSPQAGRRPAAIQTGQTA